MAVEREQLEQELSKRLERGDRDGAATMAIEAYGEEIYSFLRAVHHDDTDAEEVYASFTETFWQALTTFERNSSFRTYAYGIARRLSLRYRRDIARKNRRFRGMESSTMSRLVHNARSRTAEYLRTDTRSRLVALRMSLPTEDQELLMLRVDRRLPWEELAEVLRGEDVAPLTNEERRKEAARLRKRFQILKERLRQMAEREGLLVPKD